MSKKYAVITEGDTVTVLPGAGFREAAAKATAAGVVRTATTQAGIGLVMDLDTAKKAGLVQARNRKTADKAAEDKEK